ncbi:SusD/RagB family nutrient-binding outer membrane lipoprotein [Daejeonella oryzae]|uniref:SusD/RagB family nutrient-binding outer membrane lipoprotein n=1 Tax=Daejeonella oryzae TaxID=1122943 RepID=UPI0004254EC2|nr:SusD/RagB family nutrient-binding outer membrane lipoprotein [Daejeonella oryzae]
MKKIFNYILLGAVLIGASSCEKYLDINENPNGFISATPDLVLPQAIVGSASLTNTFSNTLADVGGQRANGGGFGGFGDVVTYQWTNNNAGYSALWTGTYDNVNDYQYVIRETSADPKLIYSTSIARIMKSMAFARLVDQFNDVPYSEALMGQKILTPKFDKAEDIYQDLVKQLDTAMIAITAAQAIASTPAAATVIVSSTDPLFGGNMTMWKQYANTLKLRLLIKMAGVPALQSVANQAFTNFNTSIGFINSDAIVNPVYVKIDRPNPTYNSLGYLTTGAISVTSRIPTRWMYSFYNGTKLSDSYRGKAVYRSFPSTIINQLGDESAGVPAAPSTGTSWSLLKNKDAIDTVGITKGAAMGQPIMLAAESQFLQAEAYARGYLAGDSKIAFDNGIAASFTYLYKDASNKVKTGFNVAADVAAYQTENALSYLVNYDLAVTLAQKIEAIITQKYIAFNMIQNDEAFNEFRRTGYPAIVDGSIDPTRTFASKQSTSTRPDKLPSRILYPQTEYNLNPTNVPAGINQFTSRIFWDLN